MSQLPFISVVIPCRNEEAFIKKCLDSLFHNDYPSDRLEVFVVDGGSADRTRTIVEDYERSSPQVRLLDNPRRITPVAMNIGVRNARGDVIVIMGAHSTYRPDYFVRGVRSLEAYRADLVGGGAHATPSRDTLQARAIALTLGSVFGVGGSSFRKGVEGPQEADTVFGGFYRKEVFQKIGLFNEHLAGSQDFEFNLRLKRAGGKIMLIPELEIAYYPKPTLAEFFAHNIKDGTWAILPLKFGAALFKPRHLLPLFFVGGLLGALALGIIFAPFLLLGIGVLALYLIAACSFSLRIAARERDVLLFPFLVAAFAARHFGYGIGSLIGLVKLAL